MNAQTQFRGPSSEAPKTGWPPETGTDPMPPAGHPADAVRDTFVKLGELREFAAYYAAAKADAWKAAVRNAGIYAVLGLMGAAVGVAVLVVAVVLVLRGIAGAFAALFPLHPWLGDIITGVIFLAIPAVGVVIALKRLTRSFHQQTVDKYEQRKRQQRQRFGRDVGAEARAESAAGRPGPEAH